MMAGQNSKILFIGVFAWIKKKKNFLKNVKFNLIILAKDKNNIEHFQMKLTHFFFWGGHGGEVISAAAS